MAKVFWASVAARFDALVAEHALRVVTDVELVVHLDGLGDLSADASLHGVVMAGLACVALARRGRLAGRPEAGGIGAVARE